MEFVLSIGFTQSRSDSSLFILRTAAGTVFLLLYVDDMVLSASRNELLHSIIAKLHTVFAIKDMGPLKFFLGGDVKRTRDGFFLSQTNHVDELLDRAGMTNCKAATTPAESKPKASAADGAPLPDGTFYRSMAGALQYLTITRPDIAFAVQQVCLHIHVPHDVHLAMLKRILRYVKGTPQLGIMLRAMTSPTLTAYTDAD
jgi:hypothetical protein